MMKKKKSTSMSWFLIKYMVLMTICVGVLFAGASILLTIVSSPQSGIPEGRKLSGIEGHLLTGDYRYVQRMLLSGREGKIEIVDESGTCLYSSDKVKLDFTRTELLILMSLGDNTIGYQENVGIDDHTEYSQYKIGKDGVYDEQRIIVNGNGEILYSTIDFGKKSLSSAEIQYLSGYTADGLHIRKWGYQTRNGQKRYLIYMGRGKVTDARITHIKQFIVVTVFLTQLVLVMFLFALRLRERCIRPMNILRHAMGDMAQGVSIKPLDYRGPKELEALCESFNRMQRKLAESEQKRQKMEAERQTMLADLSHDMRTPTTVISGYARAIIDGLVGPEKQKEYLESICRRAEVLSSLTNSFYEYSRLEHPNFRMEVKPVDVSQYLKAYLASRYSDLDDAGFAMDIEIPDTPVMCQLDREQFQRVFENIINNTMKHNEQGGRIFVALFEESQSVDIIIGDDGCGIPDEMRESIFHPFVVGEKARTQNNGSGLGMSIVEKIVQLHGGTIQLLEKGAYNLSTAYRITLHKI